MRDSARFIPDKGNAARNLSKKPGSAKFFIENITSKYFLALGIIAALALVAYLGLYMVIKTNETGAAVVNYSGRQRMLSQRLAKLSHDVMHEKGEKKGKIPPGIG